MYLCELRCCFDTLFVKKTDVSASDVSKQKMQENFLFYLFVMSYRLISVRNPRPRNNSRRRFVQRQAMRLPFYISTSITLWVCVLACYILN